MTTVTLLAARAQHIYKSDPWCQSPTNEEPKSLDNREMLG